MRLQYDYNATSTAATSTFPRLIHICTFLQAVAEYQVSPQPQRPKAGDHKKTKTSHFVFLRSQAGGGVGHAYDSGWKSKDGWSARTKTFTRSEPQKTVHIVTPSILSPRMGFQSRIGGNGPGTSVHSGGIYTYYTINTIIYQVPIKVRFKGGRHYFNPFWRRFLSLFSFCCFCFCFCICCSFSNVRRTAASISASACLLLLPLLLLLVCCCCCYFCFRCCCLPDVLFRDRTQSYLPTLLWQSRLLGQPVSTTYKVPPTRYES